MENILSKTFIDNLKQKLQPVIVTGIELKKDEKDGLVASLLISNERPEGNYVHSITSWFAYMQVNGQTVGQYSYNGDINYCKISKRPMAEYLSEGDFPENVLFRMLKEEGITPDVINIETTNHYLVGTNNLQFIDLGLPSGKLWANENVKDENGNEGYFTFDEAIQTFGENLPSREDWKELFDNSTYKWNTNKKGFDITGPNGNSIFLPAAGCRSSIGVSSVGDEGDYWSSTISNEDYAYNILFDHGYLGAQRFYRRYAGFSVRLVQ